MKPGSQVWICTPAKKQFITKRFLHIKIFACNGGKAGTEYIQRLRLWGFNICVEYTKVF